MNRPASVRDRYLQNYSSSSPDIVACGKCPECMAKRQKAVTIRSYQMALQYGNVNFLTLTYKEDMLPLSLSVWRKLNGREVCVGAPQILEPEKRYSYDVIDGILTKRYVYSQSFHTLHNSVVTLPYQKKPLSDARIREFRPDYLEGFPDDIILKCTPCHDISQVQRLIKRCRSRWNRAYGQTDWKYICVSEFGMHNTRRPHYHLLFFGCPDGLVKMIADGWMYGMYRELKDSKNSLGQDVKRRIELNPSFGDAKIEKVIAKKADDANYDGYSAVASYLGKYVSKGKYDTDAVKNGLVYVPRLVISHGLGKLLPSEVDYFLCKDKYDYDLAKPETYPSGLVESVIDRLQFKLPNGKYPLSLPTYYTNQIFGARCFKSRFELRQVYPSLLATALSFGAWPISGKTFYAPLYYQVSDCLRNKYILENQKEFEQFKANHPTTDYNTLVCMFEEHRKACLQDREKIEYERLLRRLLKSKY